MKLPRLPNPFSGKDWFDIVLSFLALLVGLFLLVCLFFPVQEVLTSSRRVPEAACTSQATGLQHSQTYYVTNCNGVATNGTCSSSVTIPQTVVRSEFSTVCSFKEWK